MVYARGVLVLAGTDLPPPRAQRSKAYSRRCTSGGVARISSSSEAPWYFFREMGIGSVDSCCVICLEMLLRFSVLCCEEAAVFDGGRVRHSTCVVL